MNGLYIKAVFPCKQGTESPRPIGERGREGVLSWMRGGKGGLSCERGKSLSKSLSGSGSKEEGSDRNDSDPNGDNDTDPDCDTE